MYFNFFFFTWVFVACDKLFYNLEHVFLIIQDGPFLISMEKWSQKLHCYSRLFKFNNKIKSLSENETDTAVNQRT